MGDVSEVWVMNADGSGKIRVSPAGQSRGSPSWSPDGNNIVVDGNGRIYMLASTGGSETLIQDYEDVETYCDGGHTVQAHVLQPLVVPTREPAGGGRLSGVPSGRRRGRVRTPIPTSRSTLQPSPRVAAEHHCITDDGTIDLLPDFYRTVRRSCSSSSAGVTVVNAGGGRRHADLAGERRATALVPGRAEHPLREGREPGRQVRPVDDKSRRTEREPLLQDGQSNGQAGLAATSDLQDQHHARDVGSGWPCGRRQVPVHRQLDER